MSFILDIVKFGLGQYGIQARGNTARAVATSAITSFLSNKINDSLKKSNPQPPSTSSSPSNAGAPTNTNDTQLQIIERQVKQEFKADPNASIPVVYGEAWVTPVLVDAQISQNNCSMFYALALCEKTGNLLDDSASTITIEEIRINNKKITFGYDGVTAVAAWEVQSPFSSSTADVGVADNLRVYCYVGDSESPVNVRPQGLAVTHGNAYDIMPGWTANHQMSNLVFAVVRVDYNKEAELTGLGSLKFKVKNSMKYPGDVLNDYMSNTVYGAGIPQEELN